MKKFGVIGFPLSHSLSPQIHNTAFQALAIDAVYEKYEIAPADFDSAIRQFKRQEYGGFNVTIPHKSRILTYMDEIDTDAAAVGAMNTVVITRNRWCGFNTDIAGFLSPLLEMKRPIGRSLVLGTGGAARAVIFALMKYINPGQIVIAGRNAAKATILCNTFRKSNSEIELLPQLLADAASQTDKFDLIINTTPVGTNPDKDRTPLPGLIKLKKNAIVYDLVYNPSKSRLLQEAEKAGEGVTLINGLEMLLQQAARSFYLWTGKEMPLTPVRQSLLKALK
jgi:shikimate dehydrogenase